jgi:hypothetical protein
MRGSTLNTLIQMLRRELKVAESPALGKNVRESYAHALASAQTRLFTDHDWPIKNIWRDVTLAAGQRYYAPPANLDMDNIRSAEIFYSGQWFPMYRGIRLEDYNQMNPETNSRNDPAQRWDYYLDTDNGEMFEVWPLPATNGPVIRFAGTRKLSPLVAANDTADLDDLLIVLFAALDFVDAKRLTKAEQKAQAYLFSLGRNQASGRTFVSGGGENPNDRRAPPRIVITPATSGA